MRLRGLTYEELVILGNLGDRLADSELLKRENEGRQIRTGTSVRVGPGAMSADVPVDKLGLLLGATLPLRAYAHGDADAAGGNGLGFHHGVAFQVHHLHHATLGCIGQGAALKKTAILPASAESISVTGRDTAVRRGWGILSDGAAYNIRGVAAFLRSTRVMRVSDSSIVLSGRSVTLEIAHKLIAESGGYNLTGQSAGKLRTYRLPGPPANIVITGRRVSLAATGKLDAADGAVSVTGHRADLGLYYFRIMPTNPGAYAITNYSTLLGHAYRLTAEGANLQLHGEITEYAYHDIPSLHPTVVTSMESAVRVIGATSDSSVVRRVVQAGQAVVRL